ncbi:MAG: EMC3/TMCO1 family protein, partial [Candidatus Ranarchaeia archaeon]
MEKSTMYMIVILLLLSAPVLILGVFAPYFPVILDAISVYLVPFKDLPMSTVFIAGLSLTLNLLVQTLNRLLVDQDRKKRSMIEIKKYQSLVQKARKSGSKKLQLRVKRREKYIQKLQGNQAKSGFKPMLYYMIPFMLFFQILNGFYNPGGVPTVVAIFPFNLDMIIPSFFRAGFGTYIKDVGYGMYFVWWYML